MSDQEREAVGSLARWFHNAGDGGVWESFDWAASVEVAGKLLASDWLAARDAALIAEAKADEREQIAAAIEERGEYLPLWLRDNYKDAARIARAAYLTQPTPGRCTCGAGAACSDGPS